MSKRLTMIMMEKDDQGRRRTVVVEMEWEILKQMIQPVGQVVEQKLFEMEAKLEAHRLEHP
jgi:hypothetical protein